MARDPFEVLGISGQVGLDEIRKAYRLRVKKCHPDQFIDPVQQKKAQEELIELNLAYEEAGRLLSRQRVGFNSISEKEAKHFALRLIEQKNWEGALRQLLRASIKDAEWYALHGRILMKLKRYEEAHESYRNAVKLVPNNRRYREGALESAIAMKKSEGFIGKIQKFMQRKKKK